MQKKLFPIYSRDWENKALKVTLKQLNALRIAHLKKGKTVYLNFDSIVEPDFYAVDGFGAKHCLFLRGELENANRTI